MSAFIAADHPTPIDPTAGLSSAAFGWTLLGIFWLGAALIGAGFRQSAVPMASADGGWHGSCNSSPLLGSLSAASPWCAGWVILGYR